MPLHIDLTGSSDARDELDYLQDARQAVQDLLLPDNDLDRAGRERLCILLTVLTTLERAVQTVAAAPDLIHEFEQGPQGGMASVPYRDPADQWTIGWGHLIRDSERFDRPLTAAQADTLLRSDLDRFAAGVNARVTVPITQSMFDALVCFSFNVGLGALAGSTLLRLLNQQFYAAAAGQFQHWNKVTEAGQKIILPGLSRRRAAERALFERDGLQP